MAQFTIHTEMLPQHCTMSTAHWSPDEQKQFATAVQGIRGTPWFVELSKDLGSIEKERVALAFAFAAFASIRRKASAPMAADAELMLDNAGLGLSGVCDNK